MLGTKELYDLMDAFEKAYRNVPVYGLRLAREDREQFARKNYYQHGDVNRFFLFFMAGHAYGKSVYQEQTP